MDIYTIIVCQQIKCAESMPAVYSLIVLIFCRQTESLSSPHFPFIVLTRRFFLFFLKSISLADSLPRSIYSNSSARFFRVLRRAGVWYWFYFYTGGNRSRPPHSLLYLHSTSAEPKVLPKYIKFKVLVCFPWDYFGSGVRVGYISFLSSVYYYIGLCNCSVWHRLHTLQLCARRKNIQFLWLYLCCYFTLFYLSNLIKLQLFYGFLDQTSVD